MIEQMQPMDPPEWLMTLSEESRRNGALPLKELLEDSLYYPGAGSDGNPVAWLGGNVHSFVYTDYQMPEEELLADINTRGKNFTGYRILGCRDLIREELVPNGWEPIMPEPGDGDPNEWRECFAQAVLRRQRLRWEDRRCRTEKQGERLAEGSRSQEAPGSQGEEGSADARIGTGI